MTVFNLGSINIDHVYRVRHLVQPGETLAADSHVAGLGGKGANQSVAAARAGARTVHIGAVGPGADRALDQMRRAGVDTGHVAMVEEPTGHAIIEVDEAGENAIILFPGANIRQEQGRIRRSLGIAVSGDTLLLQNETSEQVFAAAQGRERGMRVIYSAAPFCVAAVRGIAPYVSVLAVNAIELGQLEAAFGRELSELDVPHLVITCGAEGAEWRDRKTGNVVHVPAFPVAPVDTTAAGDCFAGYVAARLDAGLDVRSALVRASAAAALKVTRAGTASGIPTGPEVDAFLKSQK